MENITPQQANDANTLIGILKRPRARKLDIANPVHVASALQYIRLGRPAATAADASVAMEIVKSNVSQAELFALGQEYTTA